MNSSAKWLRQFILPYKLTLFGTFLSLCLAAGTVLFLGQGMRTLVDVGFSTHNAAFLNKALGMLLVLVFILSLASFARAYLSAWLGERVTADIKTYTFKKLLTSPPTFYQNHSSGSLQARLHTDTTLIKVLLGGSASTGLRSIIQFLGAMTLLFISNLKLAGLACLIIPLLLLPLALFGRRVKGFAKDHQDADGLSASYTDEQLSAIETVQAYNQERRVFSQFMALNAQALKKSHQRILTSSTLSTSVIFLVFAAVSGLLWYGGQEVISQNLSSGELISFIFYAILAAGSLNSLSQVHSDWQRAMGACERLQEIIYTAPAASHHTTPLPEDAGKISFKDISFSYPGPSSDPVLKNCDLSVKRGETIALVGPSGAGKTTFFNLLLKFYAPSKGQIEIEDIDINEISTKDVRHIIGWVPQEPVVFDDTVYNNIRFSSPSASDEQVEAAARTAYAADFIEKLPDGFNTLLGPEGVRLSSGQQQRLAIARAVLKSPSILLLDEATNALDAVSEFQVQKALDRLMKGRTTLIVAHRLSTVLKADRIVVVDQGSIVASGTHTSLMRNCPIYRRFVSLQFDTPSETNELSACA